MKMKYNRNTNNNRRNYYGINKRHKNVKVSNKNKILYSMNYENFTTSRDNSLYSTPFDFDDYIDGVKKIYEYRYRGKNDSNLLNELEELQEYEKKIKDSLTEEKIKKNEIDSPKLESIVQKFFKNGDLNIKKNQSFDYYLFDCEYNFDNKPLSLSLDDIEYSNSEKEIKLDCISIVYKIEKKYQAIKLFGEYFVEINKDKCKLEIEGEENQLCNYIFINNHTNKKYLLVKL